MGKSYQIRSDFADEILSADIRSKTYEHIEKQNANIKSNYIKVLLDENELGKAKGDYVSIECKDLYDHDIREQMVDAILENLQHMSANMNIKMKKILVVGLGNRFITSDALGPGVANEILVTAHLYAQQSSRMLSLIHILNNPKLSVYDCLQIERKDAVFDTFLDEMLRIDTMFLSFMI